MTINRMKRGVRFISRYRFGRNKGTTHYQCDFGYRIFISKHDLETLTLPELKLVLDIKLQDAATALMGLIEQKRREIAEDLTGVDLN